MHKFESFLTSDLGITVSALVVLFLYLRFTLFVFNRNNRTAPGLLLYALTTGTLGFALKVVVYDKTNYALKIRDDKIIASFKPSPELLKFAGLADLSETSRRLLYAHRPLVSTDKAYIISKCDQHQNTRALTFGCYRPKEREIFILDLQDERLAGLTATTVAHEILHAAYDRLDRKERAAINEELERIYNGKLKAELEVRLKDYNVTGDDFTSELHSIIGTEVESLPPTLAKYYDRYFKNRMTVVTLHKSSFAGIQGQHDTIRGLDLSLTSLKSEIDYLERRILNLESQIGSLKQTMPSAPDQRVVVIQINELAKEHNELVAQIQPKSIEYNSIVKKRNALVQDSNKISELVSKPRETP